MSLADDTDFCSAVVEQSSQIIASEVGKLQNKLNAERKERQQLQKRVESLEAELEGIKRTVEQLQSNRCEGSCQKTIFDAFSAALAAVTPLPQNEEQLLPSAHGSQMDLNTLLSAVPVGPGTIGPMTSTPMASRDSRKKARKEATAQIIDNLDLLPEALKNQIQPFYKVDNQASQDKLNLLQRAFVKFKAHQLHTSGETTSAAFVQSVIKEGIEERLWESDYNPGESGQFDKYLFNRLKNEKKALRRRESLQNQHQLVDRYLEESMLTNQDE